MVSSINVRECHEDYVAQPALVRLAIDEALDAAVEALERNGLPVANDDRAEELAAAIYHFVCRSGSHGRAME